MKMTKKQAKIILIAGWSIFAVVYGITMALCLIQKKYWIVFLLIALASLIVQEWKAYVRRLKKKK